jgi:uncharacterized membrane protein YgcG
MSNSFFGSKLLFAADGTVIWLSNPLADKSIVVPPMLCICTYMCVCKLYIYIYIYIYIYTLYNTYTYTYIFTYTYIVYIYTGISAIRDIGDAQIQRRQGIMAARLPGRAAGDALELPLWNIPNKALSLPLCRSLAGCDSTCACCREKYYVKHVTLLRQSRDIGCAATRARIYRAKKGVKSFSPSSPYYARFRPPPPQQKVENVVKRCNHSPQTRHDSGQRNRRPGREAGGGGGGGGETGGSLFLSATLFPSSTVRGKREGSAVVDDFRSEHQLCHHTLGH